jgi:hypothetical protein
MRDGVFPSDTKGREGVAVLAIGGFARREGVGAVRGVRVIGREAGAVSWEMGLRRVDVDVDETGRVIEIVGTAATLGCLNIGSSNSSSPVISSEGAGACTDDVKNSLYIPNLHSLASSKSSGGGGGVSFAHVQSGGIAWKALKSSATHSICPSD